jgi:hypothetical protein
LPAVKKSSACHPKLDRVVIPKFRAVPTATLPIDSNFPEPPTLATVQGPIEVLINSTVDHRALPPPAPAIRRPPPARPQSPDALWDLLHASAAVRRTALCHWRTEFAGADGQLRRFRRRGCERCEGHGHFGRLGIHELMLADDEIRVHIRHREPAAVLQQAALGAGMKTLRQDGIDKVLAGLTDLSEVTSATQA